MADTIVVTAPAGIPSFTGYGGGNYPSINPGSGTPNEGQLLLQVTLPYYESGEFCVSTFAWVQNYMKTHNMNDPLTRQIVANNIAVQCGADKNIVMFRGPTYMAFRNPNSWAPSFNYTTGNIQEMSGRSTTPMTALAHYIWGKGATRSVKLENVGLKIKPEQIKPVIDKVKSGATGTFTINSNFSRDTSLDGIIPAAYLGNISMKTEGTLKIDAAGNWNYNGVVRAYNDVYDANPSTHRGPTAEASTYILAKLGGQPYEIQMPGQLQVSGTGKR